MKRLIHLGRFLVLLVALPVLADGGPVEIRKVEVFPAGGEVRVESELGRGSTFHVRIPLSPE